MENETDGEENDVKQLKDKVSTLENELNRVTSELEAVQKKLIRVERQYEKSTCYNEELRQQIEDLNGQLHAYRTTSKCDVEVQVDPEVLKGLAPRADDQGEALPADWSVVTSTTVTPQAEENVSIADSLKAAAEEALQDSGVVYHEEYGMYYDYNTGYYHDPERSLYYEPHSGVYYYYNQETQAYEFHSQVDLSQYSTPQYGGHGNQPQQANKDDDKSTTSAKKRGRRREKKEKVENHSHHRSKKKKRKKEKSVKHKKRKKKDGESDEESNKRRKKRSKHKSSREKVEREEENDDDTNVMEVESQSKDNQEDAALPETADKSDDIKGESLNRGEEMETEDGEVEDEDKDDDKRMDEDEDGSELEDGECSSDSEMSDSASQVSEESDISSRLSLSEEEEEPQDSEMVEEPAEEVTTKDEGKGMVLSGSMLLPEPVMTNIEDARWYPPSIRAMVTSSTCLDEGTMFLITYLGATVGREPGHQLHLPEEAVSRTHAEIRYSQEYSKYMIQDMGSSNGTWLNSTQVTKDTSFPLSHNDELVLGNTKMTLHIHPGTATCDDCEPGIVMAKLALEKKKEAVVLPNADREQARRKELKNIKKKYGLKNMNYVEARGTNPSYEDKAQERRRNVGSQADHIVKPTVPASVHVAISEENKGHRMLAKMGWKSGEGLGRSQVGITEPIHVSLPASQTAGLGSAAAISHSLDDVGGAAKTKKWLKVQQRYENLPAGDPAKVSVPAAPQGESTAKKTYAAWVKGETLEPDEETPERTAEEEKPQQDDAAKE